MNLWRMAVYSYYPTLGVLKIEEDPETGEYHLKFHSMVPGGRIAGLGIFKDFDSANEGMRSWVNIIQGDFEKNLNQWAQEWGFASKIGGEGNGS